jgi:polyhydroxybutyrate depolymerase
MAGGCGLDTVERCEPSSLAAVVSQSCRLPGWDDRPFDIRLPATSAGPLPLLLVFHGGGGNAAGALSTTCPDGERDAPVCIDHLAAARGYVTVAPNGTGTRPMRNSRTWNAGGGADGYYCSAGPACASGVDDMAYVDDLIAEVRRLADIDAARIYATGLSNGASISHRLACERPAAFAAIAPVGGPNQHGASGGACPGGVPVLQIHGTADPCAPWQDTANVDCATIELEGLKAGASSTMEGWRLRNGCSEQTVELPFEDLDPSDGSTATRIAWQSCEHAVELIRIDGGGHTWPGGDAYLDESRIGTMNRDFLGSEVMLDFFDAHPGS